MHYIYGRTATFDKYGVDEDEHKYALLLFVDNIESLLERILCDQGKEDAKQQLVHMKLPACVFYLERPLALHM